DDVHKHDGVVLLARIVASLEDAEFQQVGVADLQSLEDGSTQGGTVGVERQRQFGNPNHGVSWPVIAGRGGAASLVDWKNWPAAVFRTSASLPPAKSVVFAGFAVPC